MKSFETWGWLAGCALLAAGCGAEPEQRPVGTTDPVVPAPGAERAETNAPQASDGASDSEPNGTVTPPASPEPTAYETEKAWAEARGVVFEAGKTTVVAKRRGSVERSTTYEDTLVQFVGTTKPAQMPNPSSSTVPDVDKDGRKDLGIVRPGVYRAIGDVTFGLPGHERTAFKIVTEDGAGGLPAWRDLSGDGVFSTDERTLSEQRGYTISGIYIHYGFAPTGTKLGGAKYVGPWSVGCQNVMYEELDSFVDAVGGASATFRFAIVED